MQQNQLVLNKAFMSKKCCLKLQLNSATKSIYLHVGKKNSENNWSWQKAKITEEEAGLILHLLEGREKQISFYHSFNDQPKRIWINRDEKGLLWVRIEDFRKQLNIGEQKVFEILLEKAILASNAA